MEALNFVEAAGLFEAKNNELSIALSDYHHAQVQKAVSKFEQDLLLNATDTISGEPADANTNRAKKFLRDLRSCLKMIIRMPYLAKTLQFQSSFYRYGIR